MDILVISLAGIGDTFFATPLIKELRLLYPEAKIDALVMWPGSKDLLEGNPNLNTIYHQNLIKRGLLGTAKHLWPLRKRRYDISFNTHPQSRIAYRLVARFINARTRISHEYDNVLPVDPLLVNRSLRQDYSRHAVENNLALLALVGKKSTQSGHQYEIFLSADELSWAADYLKTNAIAGRKLLGIHVGSGGTKNLALCRWPLSSYVELTKRLTAKHSDLAVLFSADPKNSGTTNI